MSPRSSGQKGKATPWSSVTSGGGIAWSFAAAYPQMTERLIIMNLPHIKGLQRELASMGQQHSNSQYARNFQQPDSHENISPAGLAMALFR